MGCNDLCSAQKCAELEQRIQTLEGEVTAIIELYAQRANISASEALEKMITQCSQMVVTGVVEEVTEKDVFEDINRELGAINKKLTAIDMNVSEIYEVTV